MFFIQKIKHNFPQIKWEKHHVLTHGFDHVVIVLDEKIIFRFPKSKEYLSRLKDEIQLLSYLKKKVKVGIPDYKYVSKDKSFAGYDVVHGRELTASDFFKLSVSDKNKVAKQLAEFISTLHAMPKSVAVKHSVRFEDQKEQHQALVRDIEKLVFPRLKEQEIQVIEEYFTHLRKALSCDYTSVLTHSDLSWEHILWDHKREQVNIIDFSDRAFTDAAVDFSGLFEYGAKFVEKVFTLYSGRKDRTMLERSQLYFKRIPLSIMKNAVQGRPVSFKQGYIKFKKIFKV